MKKRLSVCLIALFLTTNVLSSPLIFKATKEVNFTEFTEIANFSSEKYSKIRISIDRKNESDETLGYVGITIFAIEDGQEIVLDSQSDRYARYRNVIDVPPSKIKIDIKGKGIFSVYVWGSQ